MDTTPLRLCCGAVMLACAGLAAHAETEAAAAAQRVDIVAPRAGDAALDAALRDIDQRYLMSDGRRLSVVATGRDGLRVRYGRQPERQLQRQGSGSYSSRDGLLALRFELDARGDPAVAHLTMPSSWQ